MKGVNGRAGEVAAQLHHLRRQWTLDVAKVCEDIRLQGVTIGRALDRVSREDALVALKDQATKSIEALR